MPVPDGELGLSPQEQGRLERAVQVAEQLSGLRFSVFLGVSEEDARRYAVRLHGALPDPDRSVLVLCDPVFHRLEIVTGPAARRLLDDVACRFAAASMVTSFEAGDVVGGLVTGITQLGQSAQQPEILHTARPL